MSGSAAQEKIRLAENQPTRQFSRTGRMEAPMAHIINRPLRSPFRSRLRAGSARLLAGFIAPLLLIGAAGLFASAPRVTRSAVDAVYTTDGRFIAVADQTGNEVTILEPSRGRVTRRIPLRMPWGVCALDGRVYATLYDTDTVAEIDPSTGRVVRRLKVGAYPRAIAALQRSKRLLVANTGTGDISVIDLKSGRAVRRLLGGASIGGIGATPDETMAIAPDLIPVGDARREDHAATVGLFDLRTGKSLARVALPAGAVNARGVAVTPDSRWAMIVHSIGRYNVPTTQLDRGWVNTNALSIIDLKSRTLYATVLLDQAQDGAADPWGVAMDRQGKRLWITLSGVHELAAIDFERLMRWIAGGLPDDHPLAKPSPEWSITTRNIWLEITEDPERRRDLVDDLSALYVGGLIKRYRLAGHGPRGLCLSPDGRRLAIAEYFSGSVSLMDTISGAFRTASLGPSGPPDAARRGEQRFHDATLSFQRWMSCATCHPDGRADGLNWDLLNDGMGNPKNNRSLLNAHRPGPKMAHGIRATFSIAVAAGFKFFHRTPQKGEQEDIEAYIRSMRPFPSPHRIGPDRSRLSPKALEGKALFESKRTRCASCHSGPLFTDGRIHDTGTRDEYDTAGTFVTPPLVEVWRTAPYLHDGSAVTIMDVLTGSNRSDRHGVTSHLSRKQLEALAEYVLSL